MPMLRRMMQLGCTLVDYEKVTMKMGAGSSSSVGMPAWWP